MRADDGLIETLVERHDFRVDAETGHLREFGPVYKPKGRPENRWGLAISDYPQFERALSVMGQTPELVGPLGSERVS